MERETDRCLVIAKLINSQDNLNKVMSDVKWCYERVFRVMNDEEKEKFEKIEKN